jgi:hypothetical protein
MEINGMAKLVASVTNKEQKRPINRKGTVSFSSLVEGATELDEEVEAANTVSQPIGVAQVGGVLSLMEISPEEELARANYHRGEEVLDLLEQYRRGMIAGKLNYAAVEEIEQKLAHEREKTAIAGLEGIVDDIEIRAAVELAKVKRAYGK